MTTIRFIFPALLILAISACSPKISVISSIENKDSEILPFLLKQSDFDQGFTWWQEIVWQEVQKISEEETIEEAYVILNGVMGDNEQIYVSHSIYCTSDFEAIGKIGNYDFAKMQKFDGFGIESLFSCQVASGINDLVAECLFLVRYPNLISAVVTRTVDDDYVFPKRFGEDLLSIINDRIDENVDCSK